MLQSDLLSFRSNMFAAIKKSAEMQAETFLQQLDPVVEQLREELPQAGYDRRSLGQLIGQLMQFQEDALGVNVRYPCCCRLTRTWTIAHHMQHGAN